MYEYHLINAIETVLDWEFTESAMSTAHMLANLYFE